MNFFSLLVAVVYLKGVCIGAGPTGVQTVFSKIRETTKTNCLYLTHWFKTEPDYLSQCPGIGVVTSVKFTEIDSNKYAFLCNLFLNYFETLCDAHSKFNNTLPDKPSIDVEEASAVCTKLFQYQHDSNLTKTKCDVLCTNLDTVKAEKICSAMVQLASLTDVIRHTPNKMPIELEQPMRSDQRNMDPEQPVRSNAPQLVPEITAIQGSTQKLQTQPVDKPPVTPKVEKKTEQEAGEAEVVKGKKQGDLTNVNQREKINEEQEPQDEKPEYAVLKNIPVDESNNAQETVVESQGDGAVKQAQGKTPLQKVAKAMEPPRVFEEEADIDGDTQEDLDLDENVPPPMPSNIEKIRPPEKISKPLEVERDEELNYSANFQNQNIDDGDSYFFSYFVMVCVTFIGCYVAYHNKQKILALVLEGRRGRRPSRSTRRPNSANYHKLDSNLEEAINSSCNKNTSQVIY